jgi:hypothetical protein
MLVVPGAGSILTESEPTLHSFVLMLFLHANRHPLRARTLQLVGSFPTHKAGAREIKARAKKGTFFNSAGSGHR